MDAQKLVDFLNESKDAGYASQDESTWKKEEDKSTTIKYSSGDWSFHDNYYGGEPYGGRQVVFYHQKPIWMNVYYGSIDENFDDIKGVYSFLKESLAKPRENFPLRGPENYKKNDFEYKSSFTGTIEDFVLNERIFFKNQEIYRATFVGGWVDKRKED